MLWIAVSMLLTVAALLITGAVILRWIRKTTFAVRAGVWQASAHRTGAHGSRRRIHP